MGMFDTVRVPCPKCGLEEDCQSKSGDCILGYYGLSDAPLEVLADVNRHAPNTCQGCGTLFWVKGETSRSPIEGGVRIVSEFRSVVWTQQDRDDHGEDQ